MLVLTQRWKPVSKSGGGSGSASEQALERGILVNWIHSYATSVSNIVLDIKILRHV